MSGDLRLTARELWTGVYLLGLPDAGDGILVDRTRADPDWVTVADVVIVPGPDDDLARLVCLAALAYHFRSRLAAVSPTPVRRPGNA